MSKCPCGHLSVYLPYLRVRFSSNGTEGLKQRALVDTGASVSMAPFRLVEELGVSESAVRSSRRTPIHGVSGTTIDCYGYDVDLQVLVNGSWSLLGQQTIFFAFHDIPVLLGQHHFLRSFHLVQRNHGNSKSEFTLIGP